MPSHGDAPRPHGDDTVLLPSIPQPSLSSSRRVQQRQPFRSPTLVAASNRVIAAINHTAVSLSSSDSLSSLTAPYANARQLQHPTIHRCHQRVYSAVSRFCRLDTNSSVSTRGGRGVIDASFNDLDQFDPSGHSGYTSPIPAKNITSSLVSLPAVAGTADMLSVLPPHLAAVYAQPSSLLQPPVVPLVRRRAFLCEPDQYVLLLKRMIERDMIAFTTEPLAVNGLFGVDKDNGAAIRLIVDARPVNSMFVASPHVSLPTPDIIASLNVPHGKQLYAAKVDLDNFYHRIRLPQQWWPYFCLPAVRAGDVGAIGYDADVMIYPCCKTLPMGFSHAVFIAQAAHEHIIDTRVPLLRREARLIRTPNDTAGATTVLLPCSHAKHMGRSSSLCSHEITCDAPDCGRAAVCDVAPLCTSVLPSPTGDFEVNRMRHSVYIDDLNLYYHDPVVMNAAIDQYIAAMGDAHLPAKPSKVVRPTANGLECLGIWVDGAACEVGMSVPKLQVLRASTMRLLDIGECTGRELSHIVGRYTWAMLVRRPAMAIFSAVYRFIECARDTRFTIWPSVRRELWAAAHISPLLYASIRCEWAHVVIASDASEQAAGVVYANTDSNVVKSLSSLPDTPGTATHPALQSFVTTADWRIAISHPWHAEEHINALEVRASLAAMHWAVKRPDVLVPSSTDHRKLLLLVDSSATHGAITKGRSSSHRLLRPLRTMSSLLLAAGIYVRTKWIPSALNPADRPSRMR